MKQLKYIENTISTLLGVIFLIITLSYSTYTQNIILVKEIFGSILLLFVFLLAVIYRIEKQKTIIQNFLLKIPLLFFIIIIIISSIVSNFRYRALYFGHHYFLIICSIFLMLKFINTLFKFRVLLTFINITTFLAGAYLLLQYFGYDFVDWKISEPILASTFGCCCGTKLYFSIFFPISLMSFFYLKNIFFKLLLSVTILVSLFPVILYYNEPKVYMITVPLVIILFWFLVIQKISFIKKRIVLFSSLLIIILISAMIYYKNIYENTPSKPVRKIIYKGAIDSLRDNNFFGRGLGTFQLIFPKYRNSDYHRNWVSHNTMHAHNDLLETFSDLGIVGGSIYYLCFILAIYNLLYIMKHSNSTKDYFIAMFFISSIIGYYTHALTFVFSKWFYGVYYLWFLIGLSQLWATRFYFDRNEENILPDERENVQPEPSCLGL